MNSRQLQPLNDTLYFTAKDIASILGIKQSSARVLCSRYVRNGIFVRLKNNFYITGESWRNMTRDRLNKITNFLQVPSYISFLTALAYYEVTTQVPRGFQESACLKRSIIYETDPVTFRYFKLKKEYYYGFEKKQGIFIATPEKALADALYLFSFGKYRLDFNALDISKLDRTVLYDIIKVYPPKTQKVMERVCRI